MQVKELINTLKLQKVIVDEKLLELEEIRNNCYIIGKGYEGDKVQSSRDNDRMSRTWDKYIEKREEVDELLNEFYANKNELSNILATLTNVNEYRLMSKKCLEFKSMNLIAKEMNYSRSRVYQLYNKIVERLDKSGLN